MDSNESVIKGSDVRYSACQSEAAAGLRSVSAKRLFGAYSSSCDIQGVAKMGGVACEEKSSNSQRLGQSLVHPVWANIGNFVRGRLRLTWQNLLVACWETFDVLLLG